jgi:DNA (cytosine-5)-methyltransferase 1
MRHASLFTGIGGFDLAAEWMGWENVFQCEIDPYCQKVLSKNFPNVRRFLNIFDLDGTEFRGSIDIISGGFPCQPYSFAGKRKGDKDDRHLWPENFRIIREIQPALIVGENVPGLVDWSRGLVFEQIQTDLENEGYEVQSFILPACSKGAIHKRDRVWICAYSQKNRDNQREKPIGGKNERPRAYELCKSNGRTPLTDQEFIESGIRRISDGVPDRMDRLAGLGNAIYPGVAFEIFKAIERTLL